MPQQAETPEFLSLVLLFVLQVEARVEPEQTISLFLLVKMAGLVEVEVAVVATVPQPSSQRSASALNRPTTARPHARVGF